MRYINYLLLFTGILLGTPSLHATVSTIQERTVTNECFQQELNGNYSKALVLARQAQQTTDVSRLENAVLEFGLSHRLFDANMTPRPKLLELLYLLGMEKNRTTLSHINEWTQQNLRRKGERWEKQSDKYESMRSQIMPQLSELGLVEAISPSFQTYDAAIVHGALIIRVRSRLHFLVEQWNQGIRFKHLYFLTGERLLEPKYESPDRLLSDTNSPLRIRPDWIPPTVMPKFENEMVEMVWDQSEIPADMRAAVSVHFISAPKQPGSTRAQTEDTILAWMKETHPTGRYLAVTEAPYLGRQDFLVRKHLNNKAGLDTAGYEAREETVSMAIMLDELSSWIYEYNRR